MAKAKSIRLSRSSVAARFVRDGMRQSHVPRRIFHIPGGILSTRTMIITSKTCETLLSFPSVSHKWGDCGVTQAAWFRWSISLKLFYALGFDGDPEAFYGENNPQSKRSTAQTVVRGVGRPAPRKARKEAIKRDGVTLPLISDEELAPYQDISGTEEDCLDEVAAAFKILCKRRHQFVLRAIIV